jgi:multidrug efflux pump subunit AcrB
MLFGLEAKNVVLIVEFTKVRMNPIQAVIDAAKIRLRPLHP